MSIETKLLNYQIPHFYQLYETIQHNECILDASDTGTGKTYVALALAKQIGYEPFVICPKSVIMSWVNVGKYLGVNFFGISNYESIKSCKYYFVDKNYDIEKMECLFMNLEVTVDDKTKSKTRTYTFQLPRNTLVIFDEAHRCKNHNSITSQLLLSVKKCKCKILLLSATISDKIDCFRPFGVVFGFYKRLKDYKTWVKSEIRKLPDKDVEYDDGNKINVIHNHIFPNKGSRMKIAELGDMFPKNSIISQSYLCDNADEIQKQYDIIQETITELKNKEGFIGFGKIIYARMRIELLKIPIMLDLIKEGSDNNYSLVIFVNWIDTLNYLCDFLDTECVIKGGQSMAERQSCINQFQENKSKYIIVMIQAGGVGLSLHDIKGGHPRMSIISPTWSGQDMKQVFGRIHRAGSQSACIQKIVYCAGTVEEGISELIVNKLKNISGINDNDLLGTKMIDESYEEIINKFNGESEYVKKKIIP
jgi:superfamily II DNA or RNA helicase